MSLNRYCGGFRSAKLRALLGSGSFIAVAYAMPAYGQAQTAAMAASIPEQVLVTGSLIHGTAAVGVPVTTLSTQDFKVTGALTTADLLKTLPAVVVQASASSTFNGGYITGTQDVEIHGLGGALLGVAPKTLLLVDGVRVPIQGRGLCALDPSIIPQLALDRVDVLADGASATYGSDAVAGVINLVLRRGYRRSHHATAVWRFKRRQSYRNGLATLRKEVGHRRYHCHLGGLPQQSRARHQPKLLHH